MNTTDNNETPKRRLEDRQPSTTINWAAPGAPAVPAAPAASQDAPLRAVASMSVNADGVSVFPTPAAKGLAPGHYMLAAPGAPQPQAAVSPSDLSALHLAALAAAQQWVNAEYMHARNLGKGGPGVGDQCGKAEAAAKAAIDRLAAAQQSAPVATDDFMVFGRAGNRRVDLEAKLRDALAGKEAAPSFTEAQIVAAAREMNKRSSTACGVDADDAWMIYGNDSIRDVQAVITDLLAAAPAASPVAPEQAMGDEQIDAIATREHPDGRCTAGSLRKFARALLAATPAASALPDDWREVAEALEESYAADGALDFMDRAAKIIRSVAAPAASAPAGLSTAHREVTDRLGRFAAENTALRIENDQLREKAAASADAVIEAREQALEDAAKVAEEADVETFVYCQVQHDDGAATRSNIARAIRALKRTQAAGTEGAAS